MMDMLTLAHLLAIMPKCSPVAATYLPVLIASMSDSSITTVRRIAAFLATVAEESGQLLATSENLNYSADGLANTWPSRFARMDTLGVYLRTSGSEAFGKTTPAGRKIPNELALALHRQPEKIANVVYADRMGNGDVASGDGWRYRGAGFIQLTGKANHLAAAAHFGVDPALIGDWLRSPSGAARSAAWWFASRGCNTYADNNDFDGVCDVINIGRKTIKIGDAIGFTDRQKYYAAAIAALKS